MVARIQMQLPQSATIRFRNITPQSNFEFKDKANISLANFEVRPFTYSVPNQFGAVFNP
jgi:hypothetical protein